MVDHETIRKRLLSLRSAMKAEGIDEYLITSSDDHGSEYVGDYYKVSEFFSGCTSDNVTLIISQDEARLWTDGRYFISAQREIEDTGYDLMKMGEKDVPTAGQYLEEMLQDGQVLGFDGRCVTARDGMNYRRIARFKGARVDSSVDLARDLWMDRPPMPCHPVRVLDESITGEGVEDKLTRVRALMKQHGASYLMLSKLDDIMWLFNIRGGDITCNPVAMSYALIGLTTVDFFLQPGEETQELRDHLRVHKIKLHDYDDLWDYLRDYHFEGPILLDRMCTSDELFHVLNEKEKIIDAVNPTTDLKAVKNPVELSHIRDVYLQDSVVVCHFIYELKKRIGKETITEVSAANALDAMRAEIPSYLDLSFGTISAYNANAAMAHYAPTEDSCATLQPSGFLLVDSGAQYMGGTTDVTRTIVLGDLTPAMKRDFTLVACSNLRLLYARFPEGCTGVNLDTFAREPLWKYGIDFNHGTGHGIGYILNVHEGPQGIRTKAGKFRRDPAFVPGMITSDEPGIYREGEYGIRTESITECVEDSVTEFGHFLAFAPLTYVPIDLDAIDTGYMEESDIKLLNDYHKAVYEKIAPYVEGEELSWLKEATKPIRKM
ncbi:MAG: aminopeptidase P family protein [Lachnospiraceae bacterium]|nr:aminopeptidase P family protein [Lachnospiraceae bacterium]